MLFSAAAEGLLNRLPRRIFAFVARRRHANFTHIQRLPLGTSHMSDDRCRKFAEATSRDRKVCKVAKALCSPKPSHLAPFLFSMSCPITCNKIKHTCFRRSGRNEQRSTLTPMVEFAVLWLQNRAGAQQSRRVFIVRSCHNHTHTNKYSKSNTILTTPISHPLPAFTCKVCDPFGRSLLQRSLIVVPPVRTLSRAERVLVP